MPEWAQLNPFDTPSGYHPGIHLLAALEVLTAQARREAATPLAGLLAYWFTFTEHRLHASSMQVTVLKALVHCYRATPMTTHSEYLMWLGGGVVTRPVIDAGNTFSHVENGITYADPTLDNRGRLDLSALARTATGR